MNNYFAENLKYLRESKGWSQSELSRQTVRVCNIHNKDLPKEKHIKPITQASIARWEAGENSPSIDNLVVLEETLFVRLPDLIGKNLKNKEEEDVPDAEAPTKGMDIAVRELQPVNALLPADVTVSGTTMLSSAVE